MPVEIDPPELAALVDVAERPRVEGWSLRAALNRYAQPEPQRVADVFVVLRRIDFALEAARSRLLAEGPALWAALASGDGGGDQLVGLLRAARELDGLGDVLAAWATDPWQDRPDARVDTVVATLGRRLDELGVAREERRPPPGRGGRG